MPIVFGPLGVFFGYQAKKNGDERNGRILMIAAAVCAVGSAIIGAIFVSMV